LYITEKCELLNTKTRPVSDGALSIFERRKYYIYKGHYLVGIYNLFILHIRCKGHYLVSIHITYIIIPMYIYTAGSFSLV